MPFTTIEDGLAMVFPILMGHRGELSIDGKLWVMPLLLEAFGWALAFKSVDAFYDHRRWAGYGVSDPNGAQRRTQHRRKTVGHASALRGVWLGLSFQKR